MDSRALERPLLGSGPLGLMLAFVGKLQFEDRNTKRSHLSPHPSHGDAVAPLVRRAMRRTRGINRKRMDFTSPKR
jgi:hypothetical protein